MTKNEKVSISIDLDSDNEFNNNILNNILNINDKNYINKETEVKDKTIKDKKDKTIKDKKDKTIKDKKDKTIKDKKEKTIKDKKEKTIKDKKEKTIKEKTKDNKYKNESKEEKDKTNEEVEIKENNYKLLLDENLNITYNNKLIGYFIINSKYDNILPELFKESNNVNLSFISKDNNNDNTKKAKKKNLLNKNQILDDDILSKWDYLNTLPNNENINLKNTDNEISPIVPNKEFHNTDFQFNYNLMVEKPLEFLQEQVKYLDTLPQPAQRSEEWYKARENRLTASSLADALGEGHFKTKNDVILDKCGYGTFKGNATTQWGVKYEEVAIMIYQKRKNTIVKEYGLVPHPTIPFIGASPDGITTDGIMLEIKCPPKRKITGVVPHHYWVQIQLQLETCNLELCDFEECKLVEYKNEYDFFGDIYIDDDGNIQDKMMTEHNLEKGVVIEYYKLSVDSETNEEVRKIDYLYMPINTKYNKVKKWIDEQKDKLEQNKDTLFNKVSYWYLDTYSVTPVYRNREWFQVKLPLIENFWKEVCFYRNIGCDELLKLQKKKKKDNYDVEDINEYLQNEDNNIIEMDKCLYLTDNSSVDILSEFESDIE